MSPSRLTKHLQDEANYYSYNATKQKYVHYLYKCSHTTRLCGFDLQMLQNLSNTVCSMLMISDVMSSGKHQIRHSGGCTGVMLFLFFFADSVLTIPLVYHLSGVTATKFFLISLLCHPPTGNTSRRQYGNVADTLPTKRWHVQDKERKV